MEFNCVPKHGRKDKTVFQVYRVYAKAIRQRFGVSLWGSWRLKSKAHRRKKSDGGADVKWVGGADECHGDQRHGARSTDLVRFLKRRWKGCYDPRSPNFRIGSNLDGANNMADAYPGSRRSQMIAPEPRVGKDGAKCVSAFFDVELHMKARWKFLEAVENELKAAQERAIRTGKVVTFSEVVDVGEPVGLVLGTKPGSKKTKSGQKFFTERSSLVFAVIKIMPDTGEMFEVTSYLKPSPESRENAGTRKNKATRG